MRFLLDTNILSEFRKGGRGDPGVRAWFSTVQSGELAISVMTVGELQRGAELIRRRDVPSAEALDRWIQNIISLHYKNILPVTADIAHVWAKINVPDPVHAIDGLIAATAIVHGLTLVTRNTRDVGRTGVSLHNPFTGSTP